MSSNIYILNTTQHSNVFDLAIVQCGYSEEELGLRESAKLRLTTFNKSKKKLCSNIVWLKCLFSH